MKKFKHFCPTKIVFGEGSVDTVVSYLPKNHENILLVSSKTAAEKSGAYESISRQVELSNKRLHYKNVVSPNPRVEEVEGLRIYCINNNIETIVAVGGGSVIDAAKATALCVGGDLSARELLSENIGNIEPGYLIAVPTTAGTGSEVSKGAIVSDIENNWKGGVRGDNVFPQVAILDPLLTASLPKSIALETGFDVVTHAFESFLSKASTPITELYSKEVLELVIPSLVQLADGVNDVAIRGDLMYASMLAGINLANSSTCLPHRLQYPLGANTDSAHARGLAALYPSWVWHTYPYAEEKLHYVISIMSRSLEIDVLERKPDSAVAVLEKYLKKLGMNHKLRDFGVLEEDCERYALEVDGNLALDPGLTDIQTIIKIYRGSW